MGYSPWGRKKSDTTERLNTYTFIQQMVISGLLCAGDSTRHKGYVNGGKKRLCPMELTYTSVVASSHTLH